MKAPDPRLTLARGDLASADLEGIVRAGRYVRPLTLRCTAPAAAVRHTADAGSDQRDQLLYGEVFDVLDEAHGWAWGQARRDGYVGFVKRAALGEPGPAPTHRVSALRAYAFAAPDLKAPAAGPLTLNSLVTLGLRRDRFAMAQGLGWMFEHQLTAVGRFEADFVAVAERFVGAGYLWGGREADGLDCSGLVQQAMFACGRSCPRDTDQQQVLGAPVEAEALRRGDLVFWPGHVAIMLDRRRIVHASGHHGAVVVESLAGAITRIVAAGAGRPTAHRRP